MSTKSRISAKNFAFNVEGGGEIEKIATFEFKIFCIHTHTHEIFSSTVVVVVFQLLTKIHARKSEYQSWKAHIIWYLHHRVAHDTVDRSNQFVIIFKSFFFFRDSSLPKIISEKGKIKKAMFSEGVDIITLIVG